MPRTARLRIIILLHALYLLAACSPATKYILVTDRSEVNFADGDRFYICLLPGDAERVAGMLKLRTTADVDTYAHARAHSSDPLERILFDLVRSDYTAALDVLDQNPDQVPAYLGLLLKADLSYETLRGKIPASRLVQLYQDAFEGQGCDLNKDLIKIRIRQVRYGR